MHVSGERRCSPAERCCPENAQHPSGGCDASFLLLPRGAPATAQQMATALHSPAHPAQHHAALHSPAHHAQPHKPSHSPAPPLRPSPSAVSAAPFCTSRGPSCHQAGPNRELPWLKSVFVLFITLPASLYRAQPCTGSASPPTHLRLQISVPSNSGSTPNFCGLLSFWENCSVIV